MKPTLDFHGVTSLTFSETIIFERKDGSKFQTRSLTIKGDDGQFVIHLYAESNSGSLAGGSLAVTDVAAVRHTEVVS